MAFTTDIKEWLKLTNAFVTADGDHVILFKAVHEDGFSHESRRWSKPHYSNYIRLTSPYEVGKRMYAPDWVDSHNCGKGLHFSPTPQQAAKYHSDRKDMKILAVEVKIDDVRPIPASSSAKCKAKSCRVLKEIDYEYETSFDSKPRESAYFAYSSVWAPKADNQFRSKRSDSVIQIDRIEGYYTIHAHRVSDGRKTTMHRRSFEKNYRNYLVDEPVARARYEVALAEWEIRQAANKASVEDQIADLL